MSFIAHRTCRVVVGHQSEEPLERPSVPLAEFAQSNAYALIGEPGSGKTTALVTEQQAHGGVFVTVRDFLTFDNPEWRGTTLYLDGLDEVRAGEADGRPPLEQVLKKLDQLDRPPFRLSCRWADWLGAYDRGRLDRVSSGTLTVLELDPLSDEDVERILAENHAVADPERFISQARERGIASMLRNPQNVDLLAEAVLGGHWPESRLETFEFACRMLVRDSSIGHLVASPTAAETKSLLEQAGRLCAVQVLADLAGFTHLDHVTATADYPPVPGEAIASNVGRVLRTKLFEGTSEGRLSPAHRQIAEFLAARHVSGLIDDGLPLRRVLALITGFDGELVGSFRNFAAWLGIHNRPSRKELSRLNPSGLFNAGIPGTLSTEEKRDILANLRRDPSGDRYSIMTSWRPGLGALVSPELQDEFHGILSAPDRENPTQVHARIALRALKDGIPLPALVDKVLRIVRDPSWLPETRSAALESLIAYRKHDAVQTDVLLGLLGDIEAGKWDDPDSELLRILLEDLYPGSIPVATALRHLKSLKLGPFSHEITKFWTVQVPAESTDSQRAEFLDAIAADFGSFSSIMGRASTKQGIMGWFPGELLRFRLRGSMDDVPVERLWGWLVVAAGPERHNVDRFGREIRAALERDEAKLKKLIALGVERCVLAEDAVSCIRSMKGTLFGARPSDFGQWCADRALSADTELAAAIYIDLFVDHWEWVFFDPDLTTEQFRQQLIPKPSLVARFDERIEVLDISSGDRLYAFLGDLLPDSEAQRACQAEIEPESAQLEQGYGSPHLLERAAHAYLDNTAETPGETPRDRLGRLVGSRKDLVANLLTGLLGSPGRDDLPAPSDVVAGCVRGSMPPLAFPFMAAVHQRDWRGRWGQSEMSDRLLGLAITIVHSVPIDRLTPDRDAYELFFPPPWLSHLLEVRPRSVADALTRAIRLKLAAGVLPASELRALDGPDYRDVADLVCLPLLRAFPAESGTVSLDALCRLLTAALKNCDENQLKETIRHRLRDEELPEAQRIYWVTAGFFLEPGRYGRELQACKNEPDRLGPLLDFQCRPRGPYDRPRELEASELRLLIDVTGVAIAHVELTAARRQLMSDLIWRLSSCGTQESAGILQELKDAPTFAPWARDVSGAIEEHLKRQHMSELRHRGVDQVINTLQNARPANAGDLAALIVDEVGSFSAQIRDGSASSWKHFWNVDRYNRAKDPRPEQSCRDVILLALQRRLGRLGVDAQPEGTYADEKRSDIRLFFGSFNVPVEIKRSCHRDLWTAMRSQLLPKYTRDPGADGFGIYLVFWFGQHCRCKPTALNGWVPASARELEARLREQLSGPERSRISVCVIDVSKSGS